MARDLDLRNIVTNIYNNISQNTKYYQIVFIPTTQAKTYTEGVFVGYFENQCCILLEVNEPKISWNFLFYITRWASTLQIITIVDLHQWGVVVVRLLLPDVEITLYKKNIFLKIKEFQTDWETLYFLIKGLKIIVKRADANNKSIRVAPKTIKNSKHLKDIITNADYADRSNNSDILGFSFLEGIYIYLP